MSGIYGIFRFDGAPIDPADLAHMRKAMAHYGPDGGGEWHDGPVGLGQRQLCATPEDQFELQPLQKAGVSLVAAARLDNRDELLRAFVIPSSEHISTPDSALVLDAYLKWGDDCPDHLDGDWHFAAWNSHNRKLYIARDHHGNTGLCYYRGQNILAFASGLKGLLALPVIPRHPDMMRMAQVLSGWLGDGTHTGYKDLLRLPPAHALQVTSNAVSKHRYWHPEQFPHLTFRDERDCIDQFLDLYRQAVRTRLRSARTVGIALSGGLDSGSVAALAAPLLAERGENLSHSPRCRPSLHRGQAKTTSATNGPWLRQPLTTLETSTICRLIPLWLVFWIR